MTSTSTYRRVALAGGLYLVLYTIASWSDLWTTALALQRVGAHEQNAFVVNGQTYMAFRAWGVTIAGAFLLSWCVIFASRYASYTDPVWLAHPIASFRRVVVNPWSKRARGFSPLHMLALALGFAALRFVAAINNLSILFFDFAPVGELVRAVSRTVPLGFAFCIVVIPLYYLLTVLVSPVAARIISYWRTTG